MIRLPGTDEELLAECDVETFRSRGKGGQNVNKVETGVRLRHRPSGLVVVSRKERSQYRNKLACLERLREKIVRMNRVVAPRVPTKMPRAARQKIVDQKKQRGALKKLRRRADRDD